MNMYHLKHTHLYRGVGQQQLENCCLMGSKEEPSQVAKRMSALLMLPVQAGAELQKMAPCCGDNTVKKPWIRHCRAMLVFFHMYGMPFCMGLAEQGHASVSQPGSSLQQQLVLDLWKRSS